MFTIHLSRAVSSEASTAAISTVRGRLTRSQHLILLALVASLLSGLFIAFGSASAAHAAPVASRAVASGDVYYTVRSGDTLSAIATHFHTTVAAIAQANNIKNVSLIYVGERLRIPQSSSNNGGNGGDGGGSNPVSSILPDGSIRWYDTAALDSSTRDQVKALLIQAAARYHLPPNLLLAIAWQESGWTQHVIAYDGGIGVMQLMPYTAQGLNASGGLRRDPYHLQDNINLGATLLQSLYSHFHGNLQKTISAYNEGQYGVDRYGIYNWRYVNSVMSLMKQFK